MMDIKHNISLSQYTSIGVGGAAEMLVIAENSQDAIQAYQYGIENRLAITILGAGTNVLISDKGLNGLVILLKGSSKEIAYEDDQIVVYGGVHLSSLISECSSRGLGSLQWGYGIPGTVGGAVIMNAGAYGGQISDHIVSVRIITPHLDDIELPREDLRFDYRGFEMPKGAMIVAARLRLEKADKERLKQEMLAYMQKRKATQPYDALTAGCFFKNPHGKHAGKLIASLGLAGFSLDDAFISEKHCNFICNKGKATASQVLDLAELVRAKVKQELGIDLEYEVKLMGVFK